MKRIQYTNLEPDTCLQLRATSYLWTNVFGNCLGRNSSLKMGSGTKRKSLCTGLSLRSSESLTPVLIAIVFLTRGDTPCPWRASTCARSTRWLAWFDLLTSMWPDLKPNPSIPKSPLRWKRWSLSICDAEEVSIQLLLTSGWILHLVFSFCLIKFSMFFSEG